MTSSGAHAASSFYQRQQAVCMGRRTSARGCLPWALETGATERFIDPRNMKRGRVFVKARADKRGVEPELPLGTLAEPAAYYGDSATKTR